MKRSGLYHMSSSVAESEEEQSSAHSTHSTSVHDMAYCPPLDSTVKPLSTLSSTTSKAAEAAESVKAALMSPLPTELLSPRGQRKQLRSILAVVLALAQKMHSCGLGLDSVPITELLGTVKEQIGGEISADHVIGAIRQMPGGVMKENWIEIASELLPNMVS
ncbi:unnamed protein product [Protopolystoma xenopodis]|uniref:Uncharacterized protein n=1 Tax=Protopolystoma xenopodis TaxID=117903 RepID=A0A3S5BBI8_9PLAT|nr:unnamed protein product [Protopolystoma xenopodis]